MRTRRPGLLPPIGVVLCLVLAVLASRTSDAQYRRAFFANTVIPAGIRYGESDFQALPGAVTEFDAEKDTQVVFIVVLDTPDPVKVQGVLKKPSGERHGGFDADVPAWGRVVVGQTFWRSQSWRWPLEPMRAAPGRWSLDLQLNGKPAGTYTFVLKSQRAVQERPEPRGQVERPRQRPSDDTTTSAMLRGPAGTAATVAGQRLRSARFVKERPAQGLVMKPDFSNAPAAADVFDAAHDLRVVFLYGIDHEYRKSDHEVLWFAPGGGVVYKTRATIDASEAPTGSGWRWHTSVANIERLRSSPGQWSVRLMVDGELAGQYAFLVRGLPTSSARADAVDPSPPEVRIGDRWIRSDGVLEIVGIDGDRIQATLGASRRVYVTRSGGMERVMDGDLPLLIYDPVYPVLRWPMRVGARWEYEGKVANVATGDITSMAVTFEVVAYEEVTVPAGTFQAYRIVSGGVTQWYSPAARTVVKRLVSIPSVMGDFELVVDAKR